MADELSPEERPGPSSLLPWPLWPPYLLSLPAADDELARQAVLVDRARVLNWDCEGAAAAKGVAANVLPPLRAAAAAAAPAKRKSIAAMWVLRCPTPLITATKTKSASEFGGDETSKRG